MTDFGLLVVVHERLNTHPVLPSDPDNRRLIKPDERQRFSDLEQLRGLRMPTVPDQPQGRCEGLFAPLRRRGTGLVSQMVITVGLAILMRNIFLFQFGGDFRFLSDYNSQIAWDLGPVAVTARDFTITVLSAIVLVSVALVLQRTRLGKATRAVSDNGDLASATGIDTAKIIRLVWISGAALAALGGIFRGLDEGINPDMGGSLLFLMFAGVTLGGLGSAYGALIGGILIGVFVEISTLFGVPTELKTVPALVVLILVLLVRPQGIMGQRQRVG